jgi:hypothetical protein
VYHKLFQASSAVQPTMDPLKHLFDVHDLIFQHLTVDEILEVSLVSRNYYKTIGKSNAAMKQVWLNIGDRFNEPKREDLKAFRASDRNYQNFKMSEIENGLQILLFPKRQWKRGQIDIQSFLNFRDFVNLLEIFHETIEELEIFDMDIEFVEHQQELKFDELKKLRVAFVTALAMKPFMKPLGKLEKLTLEDVHDFEMKNQRKSVETITKFLELQTQLTHLSLSGEAFVKTFEDRAKFDFELIYLRAEFSGESKKLLQNFQTFLESQKKLQWLTLCEWTDVEVVQTIFRTSSISRLSFDYFDSDSKKIDSNSLNLSINQNIVTLDFEVENLDLNWVKPFLLASPKVGILYFFHVNQEVFDFVLKHCKNLRRLKYCSIFSGFKDVKGNSNVEIVEQKFVDFRNADDSCF